MKKNIQRLTHTCSREACSSENFSDSGGCNLGCKLGSILGSMVHMRTTTDTKFIGLVATSIC